MIVKYLKNDSNTEKWFKRWEGLNDKKEEILKNKKSVEEYEKTVKEQSEMLLNSNISRVERYMSGIDIDFVTDNKTVDLDDIYCKEMFSLPKSKMHIYSSSDVNEKEPENNSGDNILYYIIYDKEVYCKTNNGFRITDIDLNESREGVYCICDDYLDEIDDKESKIIIKELENALNSQNLRLDYIKSTPALYSFSQGYKKTENKIDPNYVLSNNSIDDFDNIFFENEYKCDSYNRVMYNSRIAGLFKAMFEIEGIHKLLFIPPVNTKDNRILNGVYKDKKGTSKRLFFTDYQMTPKSLSVILTYEASRRTVNDLKEKFKDKDKIRFCPTSDKSLYIDTLFNYSGRSNYKKESDSPDIVDDIGRVHFEWFSNILLDYLICEDKKQDSSNYGSPFSYVSVYKDKLFTGNDDAEIFCRAYFKYMCQIDSLRVVLAYYSGDGTPDSIYDAIIQYGKDACIWDIFDEYSEYIVKDRKKGGNEESFAEAFKAILDIKPKRLDVRVKSDNEPYQYHFKDMPTDFAYGHYAGAKDNASTAKTLERKIRRFNSPFRPFCFISTSIGQEGFDFHTYCRKIVHWSLEYNPVKFEQREGRVNRYQGYANRLKLSEYMDQNNIDFSNWKDSFENVKKSECGKNLKDNSKGLFPDYVVPEQNKQGQQSNNTGLVREAYYYPGSFEEYYFDKVLLAVGYYRSLLGQSGSETFEEDFKNFVKDNRITDEIKNKLFINLYPK